MKRISSLSSSDKLRLASNPSLSVLCDQVSEVHSVEQITIVVVGASGDLACKKTFPALFSLFYHELLPPKTNIVGYARSPMEHKDFIEKVLLNLTCRVISREKCAEKMDAFLECCSYVHGQYDSAEDFLHLHNYCRGKEDNLPAGRLFYLAIPPTIFGPVMGSIQRSALADVGWTRVIVEKPFGRNLETYLELRETCSQFFSEEQIYRIDHYVGKEVVQNISTLRFGNYLFGAMWSKEHIRSVQIIFKENFGTQGRAGYFDTFGIIRDIMQNHLLQVLAYVAMERPDRLCAEEINRERLAVLKAISPLTTDDVCVGQYDGYLDEKGVAPNSITPTFAICKFKVNTPRWEGVPFLMKAGKGLDERKAEVRISFRGFPSDDPEVTEGEAPLANELVIRIQPNEGVHLTMLNKTPGLRPSLSVTNLDLSYSQAFSEQAKDIPDAYERLILDAVVGEKSLFIHDEQLEAAWKIFDPVLRDLEEVHKVVPHLYLFGSRGPAEQDRIIQQANASWSS